MDAGSLDRLYSRGIQEPYLAKITISIIKGLAFLKHELSVIHRDIKPTNVLGTYGNLMNLVNSKGQVKLCDFGVSGQLVQSLAKTNIGCQSYMAVRFPLFVIYFLARAHQCKRHGYLLCVL